MGKCYRLLVSLVVLKNRSLDLVITVIIYFFISTTLIFVLCFNKISHQHVCGHIIIKIIKFHALDLLNS